MKTLKRHLPPDWLRTDEDTFRQALAARGITGRGAKDFLSPIHVKADRPTRLAWEAVATLASNDPDYLAALRREGVRDADIAWYWGLGVHVRLFLQELDNMDQGALFLDVVLKTGDPDLAKATVMQHHASYTTVMRHHASYSHEFGAKGQWGMEEDRRLPWELRDGVDLWIERWSRDPVRYVRRLARASSVNAAVREDILAGAL